MSSWSASQRRLTVALGALIITTPAFARADDDPSEPKVPATWGVPAAPPEPQPQTQPPPAKPPESGVPVAPEHSEERAKGLEPKAVETPPPKLTFAVDPIADGGIILAAGTFAFLLEQINGTGEVRPQQISPTFDAPNRLLGIDRGAIDQKIDQDSLTRSNIALFAACGFAAVDPILTGVREKHVQAGLVDGVIYAQAIAVTFGVTNLAKIAVRRPRPAAYIEAAKHKDDPNWSNADTDSALSFFSGHASITATIGATATYLAFVRAPNLWRPLITLGVATGVTVFTSMERVRGGAHFPTDVIAGALAGAGIGVIVTHLHRSEDVKQRRIWVGYAPVPGEGGGAQVGGMF